jgi:hypothetical protein
MTMPDKVGLVITVSAQHWLDYTRAFQNMWVKLGHQPNTIVRVAAGADPASIGRAVDTLEQDMDVKVIVTAGTQAALVCKAKQLATPPTLTKHFVYASVGDPALSRLSPAMQSGIGWTGGSNRQAEQLVVQARVDWMLAKGFLEPCVVVCQLTGGPEPLATPQAPARDYLRSLGFVADKQTITPQDTISTMIQGFKTRPTPVQSLYVCSDPYLTTKSTEINNAAHDTTQAPHIRIRTMYEFKEHMNADGGDAWFGSDFAELFQKAAQYAHEIMSKTATPATLPVYIASLGGDARPAPAPIIKKASKKKVSRKKK